MRRTIGVAALAVATVALAGCEARSHPATSSSPATTPSASATAPVSDPGTTPSGPATTAATATASGTSAPPTTPSTSPAAPGSPGCTTGALRTTVLRGSGIAGRQFARITFTNTSAAACSLTGYPGVSLLRAGATLGQPAERSGKPAVTVTLAPGASASTMVTDYSTCNAPDADTMRIYPPNQTVYVDAPLNLTGCRLVVDPVAAGS